MCGKTQKKKNVEATFGKKANWPYLIFTDHLFHFPIILFQTDTLRWTPFDDVLKIYFNLSIVRQVSNMHLRENDIVLLGKLELKTNL